MNLREWKQALEDELSDIQRSSPDFSLCNTEELREWIEESAKKLTWLATYYSDAIETTFDVEGLEDEIREAFIEVSHAMYTNRSYANMGQKVAELNFPTGDAIVVSVSNYTLEVIKYIYKKLGGGE